jgi:prepilin signal peptidase PulO-like enzyme (type II secretory pathway)
VTTPVQTPPRSAADRLARQLLRVDQAEPRALMPLKGSLVISAVRCVITYAIIPALAPVLTGLGGLAAPIAIVLSFVAGVMAVVSLRRVWLADWSRRWAYTAFILVVLALLATTVVFDARTLLA